MGESFSAISEIFILADNFGLYIGKTTSFSSYIKTHSNRSGPITHQKLVPFNLVWICKFLFCCKSVMVVKAHLTLAATLAEN